MFRAVEFYRLAKRFVRQYGNFTVGIANHFYAHIEENRIYYNAYENDPTALSVFREVCRDIAPDISDNFHVGVMLFLHEIGHFKTQEYVKPIERIEYELLAMTLGYDRGSQYAYMMCGFEYKATAWAVRTYMANESKMLRWGAKFDGCA